MKALSLAVCQAVAFRVLRVICPPAGLFLILLECGRMSAHSGGCPGRRFPFVAPVPGGRYERA